ncbi:MAG: class I SAM-dependent methyltransferase [Candidatus Omnitrophica bacterium]|nr:class I SAM-dependent methyltransferase [Candidatus Omnitrophota bacterium]MDD5660349.1 class I SAM-dependent methyltransferase [Candidatus Omnitrophota bacterium]
MAEYSLSQNYFLYWYQGDLYITNPIDVLGAYRSKIDPGMVDLLLRFLRPCDLASVEEGMPVSQRKEKMAFLKKMIAEKVLVSYRQFTDMGEIVTNMVKTIRAISSNEQAHFGKKTAQGQNYLRSGVLDKISALVHCDRVVRTVRGKGLEIGGNVPGISNFLPRSRTLIRMDYGNNKNGSFQQDATDLSGFSDKDFDFIISSHTLEHLSNPIKALLEWGRVVKNGGYIYIVLPNKEHTADYFRPLTSLEHLQEDYKNKVPFSDPAHLSNEGAKSFWWSMEHYQPQEAPYVHMHTWNMPSFLKLLKSLDLPVVDSWESAPYNLHVLIRIGAKTDASAAKALPLLFWPGVLLLLIKILFRKVYQDLN